MRTIRIKLYKFDELSKDAQKKAIDKYREHNDCSFVWEDTKEDANEVDLKIISLDDHRPNKGEFIDNAYDTANKIINAHGPDCNTYKTASSFITDYDNLVKKYSDGIETDKVAEDNEYDFDNEADDLEEEFLKSLLEDYRIILNNDYEYQNSDEAIKDTIEANEYEFTKDGKLN